MANKSEEKARGAIPQLVTEGVSDFLTDYQRPGYTADALRQFVVLDDIEAKDRGGCKRKRDQLDEDGDGDEGDESADDQGDDDEDDEDDDDDDDRDSSDEESYRSDNSDVPLEEVDMMLEEGLPEGYKVKTERIPNGRYYKTSQQGPCVSRRLQVVDEIFSNPFDVLPEGWVRVTHNTGIPIFLHKESRVCTASMPYFLGPGSARKHRVPLSAIPCLQYRKALDKEKLDKMGLRGQDDSDAGKSADTENSQKENRESGGTMGKENCPVASANRIEIENSAKNGASVGDEFDCVVMKSEATENDEMKCRKEDNGVAKKNAPGSKVGDGESSSGDSELRTITIKEEEEIEGSERTSDVNKRGKDDETAVTKQEPMETGKCGNEVADAGKSGDLLWKMLDEPNPTSAVLPSLPKARIETAQENQESQSVNHIELREYCQKLFRYRTIDVMRFKTWSERRKFAKVKKKEKQLQRPSLPEGTKLISFPIMEPGGDAGNGGRIKKEWIMNPSGKSYVCILHECVQHALKTQPVYEFKDLENPATPYSATVSINKMKYGTGVGTSKRQAKSEAARATLEVLIPEMREKMEEDSYRGGAGLSRNQHTDLSFFDDIKIQDPRVHEFCAKTTEPSPYTILLTCLKRNFGLGDMDITTEVKMLRHQKNEFTMSVGNHTATVLCKNKREGKQRASQAILQAMHPHITSWGSLLRLYGNRSVKTLREKKQEEQEITTLQSRASANSPNWAILNKLKEAMLKLKERNAAVKPLGKFIPPSNVDLPLASASNFNNLEL